MTMYLYCEVGIYNTTTLSYSDYCTVLMLSVYMYGYYTLRIYVAVVFPYPVERLVIPSLLEDSKREA